ncbi:hypothetical protein ZYGNAAKF_CDS0193 [Enterococcus phage VRE9_2]
MEKQITKAQALEVATILAQAWKDLAIEVPTNITDKMKSVVEFQPEELTEKLEAMHMQQVKQDKAKRGKKGVSKTAKEKAENMDKVRKAFLDLEPETALTLNEIAELIGLVGATPQKLTAIMKPLVDNEEFEKVVKDKKVAYKLK